MTKPRIAGRIAMLLTLLVGVVLVAHLAAITANLNGGKFFAYGGGPGAWLDTELRGRVVRVGIDVIFIETTTNYSHLGLKGNRIRGSRDEHGNDPAELCYAGDDIIGMARSTTSPIIKLETYPVGGRPDSSTHAHPLVLDRGIRRPLQVGDYVAVSGLYVVDYSHPPYCDLHTPSWRYGRGMYMAAFAHSELHPYTQGSLRIIDPEDRSSEVHTVVAPMYPEMYSNTWFMNKLGGVAGHMVDPARKVRQRASFFLTAPPRPAGDVELTLRVTDTWTTGRGFVSRDQQVQTDAAGRPGIAVTIQAAGLDIYNPVVHRSRFTVAWTPRGSVQPPPQRSRLNRGEALIPGQSLVSPNQRFRLTMQEDGNIVLLDGGEPIWASHTAGSSVYAAVFDGTGNFTLLDTVGRSIWATRTGGRAGTFLVLQDDGNAVIYTNGYGPLWASNTVR